MIWMFRVPRGPVPGYELEAADHHSLTGDGNKPGNLTSFASVSREEKCRCFARLTLGDMEVREAGLAIHHREYHPYRSSLLSVSSRASDRRDPRVNALPSAQLKFGVGCPVAQEVRDRRASEGEDVERMGARKEA
jgi:hypothetical protein